MLLLSSAELFQNQLFQKILSGTLSDLSNSLDPDQDRHFVGPDLGPYCLQRLSADDRSRHLQRKSYRKENLHHYQTELKYIRFSKTGVSPDQPTWRRNPLI